MNVQLQMPASATEAEAGAPSSNATKGQQPKPLRFVTNYGAPHPKRRRIGAACLTCRKRKTACSGRHWEHYDEYVCGADEQGA